MHLEKVINRNTQHNVCSAVALTKINRGFFQPTNHDVLADFTNLACRSMSLLDRLCLFS